MDELKPYLLVIVGPTAVGKTALAIELAKHYKSPIISFDSRQFYQELSIGTAKPTEEELLLAEHHFIGHISVKDRYTAGMYETDALTKLDELFQNHKIVIAVGGSGLYINALVYGIDDIPSDSKIRAEVIQQFESEGLTNLLTELEKVDPIYYHSADIQNPRRVIRAIEVYRQTGVPYSTFRKNQQKERNFQPVWIGLDLNREELYERINRRVDTMIQSGLLNEVKRNKDFKNLPALRTVGYQEFFNLSDPDQQIDEAIELVKRNTRHFARKQLSWFRRNQEIQWFTAGDEDKIKIYLAEKIIH